MGDILIIPADAKWPMEFQEIRKAIAAVLPPTIEIHHIGSTAGPGLPAKDIIDIQVSVYSLEDFHISSLEKVGFTHFAGASDHCPPGQQVAEIELAKLFYRSTSRPAHIHVREKGRFNQRYALLCRDFLRSHPETAAAYALIKQRLAMKFASDIDAYY